MNKIYHSIIGGGLKPKRSRVTSRSKIYSITISMNSAKLAINVIFNLPQNSKLYQKNIGLQKLKKFNWL